MPLVTVSTIDGPCQIVADTFGGVFAVHSTLNGEEGEFTLTHLPSGYSFLYGVSYDNAVAAAQEILADALDWSIVRGQHDLTPEHKAQGRAITQRYRSWSDSRDPEV